MLKNSFFSVCLSTLLMILLLAGCSNHSNLKREEITVSILPYKFFAEELTGGKVNVNCMLSPGDNHATYQPSPRQIEGLERSAIYFTNGLLVFENSWMPNIKSNNPGMEIVDCSVGIHILEGHAHEDTDNGHGHEDHSNCSHGGDPHYWTLPSNAIIIVRNMYESLMKRDLISSDTLTANYDHLIGRLKAYSDTMDAVLRSSKKKEFMIYHPALSYIANNYGLEQISIEQEGKSPSVAQLKTVLDLAKQKEIKHVLMQKQFDKENALLVAKQIEGEVLIVDPLEYDYFKSTSDLIYKLQKALND